MKVQKGMMFFQNIGSAGIKTITTDHMRKTFSDTFGVSLKIDTISSELFIRTIMTKENIKKLTMVKNHISDDLADRTFSGYGQETRTIAQFSFDEDKWKKIFKSIRNCAKG